MLPHALVLAALMLVASCPAPSTATCSAKVANAAGQLQLADCMGGTSTLQSILERLQQLEAEVRHLNSTAGLLAQLPVGSILLWAEETLPAGFVECDGNNGTPDLRGRVAVGAGQGPGLASRPLNTTGGVEQVTLTVGQIPAHTHAAATNAVQLNDDSPATENNGAADAGADARLVPAIVSVASTGGNQPHENMQPFVALKYIMKMAQN
eukprot:m.112237 g.112237  ORF g.112237 m.112237 type:complete len:209 (-) comp19268_c0_seq1:62-688(-)